MQLAQFSGARLFFFSLNLFLVCDETAFVAGFSTTLNSAVTKSIIKTMEMNGSLESGPAVLKAKEERDSVEEEDEEEEETTRKGITIQRFGESLFMSPAFDLFGFFVAASSQPKKKEPTRKHRTLLPNGKVTSGDSHLSNGSHSRSTLNGKDSQHGEALSNGHHSGEEPAVGRVSAPCDQLIQSAARDLDSDLTSASAGTRLME